MGRLTGLSLYSLSRTKIGGHHAGPPTQRRRRAGFSTRRVQNVTERVMSLERQAGLDCAWGGRRAVH
jgi:hypothetical protein